MFRDGYYGFAEPLEFCSVVELVEFYRNNSLQPYSHKLDITLQEAVSRANVYEVENEGLFGRNDEVQYSRLLLYIHVYSTPGG